MSGNCEFLGRIWDVRGVGQRSSDVGEFALDSSHSMDKTCLSLVRRGGPYVVVLQRRLPSFRRARFAQSLSHTYTCVQHKH